MRRFIGYAFIAILLTSSSPGQGRKAKTNEKGFNSEVYKVIGPIGLSMRIYKPSDWKATDARPAIVFFFGGGWRGGSPSQFHQHSLHLGEKGMVAMAAEYRIKNEHDSTPLDSTRDAKSAIRWVRANAEKLGIDPKRIAAGGGSAGGHLAAATATIGDHLNEESDNLEISPVPNALVLFNPAVNLLFPKVKEMWGEEVFSKIKQISPYQNLTGDLPPTITFHGIADATVPYAHQEAFAEKAKDLGAKRVELVGYTDRGHGFFNFGRGGGKDYRDTVSKMDAFLASLGWLEK